MKKWDFISSIAVMNIITEIDYIKAKENGLLRADRFPI
jgi:hypothetical protein